VTYKGECCGEPDYAYKGWRDLSAWEGPAQYCTHFGGFATVTGDLFFTLAFDPVSGGLLSFQDGGLLEMTGMGAVTGTAGNIGPAHSGGIAIVDYVATNADGIADPYKIALKIPFSEEASCKLQEYSAEYLGY